MSYRFSAKCKYITYHVSVNTVNNIHKKQFEKVAINYVMGLNTYAILYYQVQVNKTPRIWKQHLRKNGMGIDYDEITYKFLDPDVHGNMQLIGSHRVFHT